jgi:hypothetical protein
VREEDLDMSQYLICLDVNGSALWTSGGVTGSKKNLAQLVMPLVPFSTYDGNTPPPAQPAIAPVNIPIQKGGAGGAGPGVLLLGNDQKSGNFNLFFWDGNPQTAPNELPNVPNAYPINGLYPQYLTPFNGAVYFNGQYGENETLELWSSGGNVSDTVPLTFSGYNPKYLATAFGQLFFNGTWTDANGNSVNGLMSYTTANGVVPIPNLPGITTFTPYCLAASPLGSAPYNLGVITPFGGFSSGPPDLPFSLLMGGTGSDGATVGLYAYDGSALTLVTNGTATGGINPVNPVSMQWDSSEQLDHITLLRYNSAVFFSGVDGLDNSNRGLWTSQGTEATTIKLHGSVVNGVSLEPYNLTPLNGTLYFTGNDTSNGPGRGLFSYDPVTNETSPVFPSTQFDFSETYEGSWNGSPTNHCYGNGSPFTMAAFKNKLFFNCLPAQGKHGLYVWDPATDWDKKTNKALPPTLVPGTGPSSLGDDDGAQPISLTVVNFS